jgi:putative sporulation protein YyaC
MRKSKKQFVIACIGCTDVVGDTLGPIVGDILIKQDISTFVYGTTDNPITSRNLEEFKATIRLRHPDAKIIAVDACLGKLKEVGKVKIVKGGLAPGKALDQNAPSYGDLGVLGVVGELHDDPMAELLSRSVSFVEELATRTAEVIYELVA